MCVHTAKQCLDCVCVHKCLDWDCLYTKVLTGDCVVCTRTHHHTISHIHSLRTKSVHAQSPYTPPRPFAAPYDRLPAIQRAFHPLCWPPTGVHNCRLCSPTPETPAVTFSHVRANTGARARACVHDLQARAHLLQGRAHLQAFARAHTSCQRMLVTSREMELCL